MLLLLIWFNVCSLVVTHARNHPLKDIFDKSETNATFRNIRERNNVKSQTKLTAADWNISLLYSPNLSAKNAVTVEDLVHLKVVHVQKEGCLGKISARDSVLEWHSKAYYLDFQGFVPGTTVWVNEFWQIGHAQYDLEVMQILASTKVSL